MTTATLKDIRELVRAVQRAEYLIRCTSPPRWSQGRLDWNNAEADFQEHVANVEHLMILSDEEEPCDLTTT